METTTVTVKGQIVIPSRIRRRYGIKKGTRVCLIERNGEIILKPITQEYIRKLAGILDGKGKALKALMKEKEREREL
ncbi:MAG TPA: AbrB/MazE/SpoVT family DNA-binding domain-containing protein [Candidatus Brocadiia bacterium]|nr:AbrB/MazE/SpoVT family DNA-binding domain-containing protein [Planctomycetota bacterium]MBI4008539.1 AbrB/MazE/SpoVT family DNA-binding domain-containing protein [Planctomycetota bacterium]MDO8094486.1 AbrB/MazE/SpoVT family DNA-binding domain-containing protein [Candidatus Brocadiales bacterium]